MKPATVSISNELPNMDKNILIIGAGYLGKRLGQELNCPATGKKIHTFNDVYSLIKKYKPKVIINAIGHTGVGNVDGCEKALDKTLHANSYIPLLLAEVCMRKKIKYVHISSGCIYHYNYTKQTPIKETRAPDYYDLFYSRSKIYAENVLEKLSKNEDILITRIRIPLDDRKHAKNLLTKVLTFNKIINVPNSITYIPDFIKALKFLITKNKRGIYNVVLKGGLYYPDLLKVYGKYAKLHAYSLIKLKNLRMKRTNLILSTRKLEKSGFKVRKVKDVLNECVQAYLKY